MTRREAVAALIVLPAALTAVPQPRPISPWVVKLCDAIAEFEKGLRSLEVSLAEIGRNLDSHCEEDWYCDALEKGWRQS